MRKYIIETEVSEKYPAFNFYGVEISEVEVTKPLQFVTAQKKKIQTEFRSKYTESNISETSPIMAMRNLFELMGIDPNTEPTAVENLTRLLYKGGIPNINSVVDSCNIASIGTLMPIGVFNADSISGELVLRFSQEGEEYEPIGMPIQKLKSNILVLADEKGVIARPMYKDSTRTMIRLETKNLVVFTAQYPPITEENVKEALTLAVQIVTTSSKGTASTIFKLSPRE